ncbi:sulfurtransferase TusA family protein [Candidatus Methylacidiphilum fumarolicum]|uniref:UPF0033 domain-containing protein n=2 Tax=Candidatus Methylacidiphilum fumarolicum TaxID=591154 RepID=I0JYF5_METFB|nr:sulfurtransferase TusA family protein [Candidatus Methylacidiphilum fumarolicum]MBW6414815.1 sulfurtransferase TusA family protein [Candidatus Methylacidiphilum fumarolicum]TFE67346.1 preprotein translocase subunit TatB [Candidatus Methylacidiphilum fumarolicum]TFE73323.1 sulfurtransferase TusA family protein [Candidatus Methylacidiphilum fumarolicum]TFE74104.1 sulfurtransferase TusA family protein [Candidatus Methylacidiphilum fumarolicum]TFE77046.1 preprotein translocase subunit TatB [Can
MEGIKITKEVDARGSFCPGPLMEMIRLIRSAQVGDVVAVISADEGTKKDLPAWIKKAKHELIAEEPVEGGATRFICKKLH